MSVKSVYKKELLKEVDDLSPSEMKKIIKILHVVKEEILIKKRVDKQEILKYAGMLKSLGSEKEKVFDDVISRRSLFMGRNVNL
ncbi:MAG: hypothetical protein HZA00_15060 [Nitrospinae bacterium]|nr:hypothetical protein [Nitrospinota bacterium]